MFFPRFGHYLVRSINFTVGEQEVSAKIVYQDDGVYKIIIGDNEYEVQGKLERDEKMNFNKLTCSINGDIRTV